MNLAQISLAQPARKWGRETLTSRTVSNLYEALTGRFVRSVETELEQVELTGAAVVLPLVKEAKVRRRSTRPTSGPGA